MKSATKLLLFLTAIAAFIGCQKAPTQVDPGGYSGANKSVTEMNHHLEGEGGETATGEKTAQTSLKEVERPQKIADMMKERGEQDSAAPVLKILEPAANSTIGSSTVKVKLSLSGDLKGYKPMKDMTTGMGNHIHVILDNQPYEAYYNLDGAFELRNVSDGEHILRVFPSRPWHESYKNDGAFQMVKFEVKNGGAETGKPTTTNTGEKMSNANTNMAGSSNTNNRTGTPTATPEGKDMASSRGGAVDPAKPLLTYSRPKGEYKGEDAENIMIDFWLLNAKLTSDGGEYRVRYSVDGGEAKFLDKWQPIWLNGWSEGKHRVKVELVDKDGNLVDNGGYNSTEREINIIK